MFGRREADAGGVRTFGQYSMAHDMVSCGHRKWLRVLRGLENDTDGVGWGNKLVF